MSIRFEVIDLSCEAADQSFFVPQLKLTTKSTTQFATVYGYNEFGIPSSPPKKYRKVTVTGYSKRIGFTAEPTPRQCAGAKYLWSGVGEVDLKGNLVQNYSKKFYAQCAKQYWPPEALQLNPVAINTGSGIDPPFVGFCWPDEPQSCSTCDPDDSVWPFINNQVTNNLNVDLSGFLKGSPTITKTSWSINDVVNGITSLVTPVAYTYFTTGFTYSVTVGSNTYSAQDVVTDPVLNFPHAIVNGYESAYIVFTDTNNYSAVLSDEYTDALALANATVVVGVGTVAENLPRTTGFTSQYTAIEFTLEMSNLIKDIDYLVTVDFVDLTSPAKTTRQYGFTADAITHTIHDTMPTPASGHRVALKNPTVKFVV